mmetsp:Transcript_51819/g.119125  ORF Transcript_51819/g.119125 Transcript_51819/m.119125 type:complete len:370 (-) Transcript_51819:24-1133(-)
MHCETWVTFASTSSRCSSLRRALHLAVNLSGCQRRCSSVSSFRKSLASTDGGRIVSATLAAVMSVRAHGHGSSDTSSNLSSLGKRLRIASQARSYAARAASRAEAERFSATPSCRKRIRSSSASAARCQRIRSCSRSSAFCAFCARRASRRASQSSCRWRSSSASRVRRARACAATCANQSPPSLVPSSQSPAQSKPPPSSRSRMLSSLSRSSNALAPRPLSPLALLSPRSLLSSSLLAAREFDKRSRARSTTFLALTPCSSHWAKSTCTPNLCASRSSARVASPDDATWSGVRRRRSQAFTSAPCATSSRTIAGSPARVAACSAVSHLGGTVQERSVPKRANRGSSRRTRFAFRLRIARNSFASSSSS